MHGVDEEPHLCLVKLVLLAVPIEMPKIISQQAKKQEIHAICQGAGIPGRMYHHIDLTDTRQRATAIDSPHFNGIGARAQTVEPDSVVARDIGVPRAILDTVFIDDTSRVAVVEKRESQRQRMVAGIHVDLSVCRQMPYIVNHCPCEPNSALPVLDLLHLLRVKHGQAAVKAKPHHAIRGMKRYIAEIFAGDLAVAGTIGDETA